MKKLYHNPICPISRQVRVYLKELGLTCTLIKEDYWQRSENLLALNPAGTLPILQEETGLSIVGIYPLTEYLREKYPNFNFIGEEAETNLEIRRLCSWFNDKFYREVTKIVIDEKVIRFAQNLGGPRTEFLRAAKTNFKHHMNYINELLVRRDFIAGDSMSASDIAGACHLSVMDYFGEIIWERWPGVKDWYSVLKSRPSFRPLLQDQVPGFTPASSYADLDF